MAKQVGPVFLTGTVGNITYYKMDGQYYARSKSSLSRKRVKRSRSFKRTMEYADWLAQASKIAAAIYRLFPRKTRQHADYRTITGQAMQLLRSGVETAVIKEQLEKEYRHKFDPELSGYIDLDQDCGELQNVAGAESPAQQTADIGTAQHLPAPKTSRRLQYYNIRGEKIQRKQGGWTIMQETLPAAAVLPDGCLVYANAAPTPPSNKTGICSPPAPAPV